ncbi:hypothetical protein [Paraburkholderia saeva]|nr:hypothetical protein [Paraburkholderia saeva]
MRNLRVEPEEIVESTPHVFRYCIAAAETCGLPLPSEAIDNQGMT